MRNFSPILVLLSLIFCVFSSCNTLMFTPPLIPQDDAYYITDIGNDNYAYVLFQKSDNKKINAEFFIFNNKSTTIRYKLFASHQRNNIWSVNIPELKLRSQKVRVNFMEDEFTINYPVRFLNFFKSKQYHFKKEIQPPKHLFIKRYENEIFGVAVRKGINYGSAKGYYSSLMHDDLGQDKYPAILRDIAKNILKNLFLKELNLDLDLYEPINDTLAHRPLIVLLHGGAFVLGDKSSSAIKELALFFTKRGYVVASVNYRMGYVFVPGGYFYLERCIHRAVQDSRAAIRYMIANSSKYRIDPNMIFVGGNSAGGFISLKTAFMDESDVFRSARGNRILLSDDLGCLDCSGNSFRNPFSVRGVINMWGAVTDLKMIHESEKIPVLSFHGDADFIVPIGYDFPFKNVGAEFSAFFSNRVYGSESIHRHMRRNGLQSKLVKFKDAGHEPHVDANNSFNSIFDTIKIESLSFMNAIIAADSMVLTGNNLVFANQDAQTYTANCNIDFKINWEIEGGKIIETFNNGRSVRVVWFENAIQNIIYAEAQNLNGSVNKNYLIVNLAK